MATQLAYFLQRLKEAPESDGSLLDRSLVLYGSSNSVTHNNRNYPLVLAGGNALGMQHGQFRQLTERTPLANLFLTMLHRLGVEQQQFADSTGEITEIIRSA